MPSLFSFFNVLITLIFHASMFRINNIPFIIFNSQFFSENDLLIKLQEMNKYTKLSAIEKLDLPSIDEYIYVNDTDNIIAYNKYVQILIRRNENVKFLIDYHDLQLAKNLILENIQLSYGFAVLLLMIFVILQIYFIITYLLKQVIIILPIVRLSTVKKIQALKKIKFSELPSAPAKECIVCLDIFKEEDDVRMLPCCHYFHPHCVDIWLGLSNDNCPVCRISTSKGQQ